jgi:hypothetical protein
MATEGKTMKRLVRAFAVTLGLAVLGSAISLVPQKNASADGGAPVNVISPLPLPIAGNVNAVVSGTVKVDNFPAFPATLTGATVPASFNQSAHFRMLSWNGTAFEEVNPDGSKTAFTLQAGESFVITDLSWVVLSGCESSSCNQLLAGGAVVVGLGPVVGVPSIYVSEGTYDSGAGIASHSDHFTTGAVVNSLPVPSLIEGFVSGGNHLQIFLLQGYVVS